MDTTLTVRISQATKDKLVKLASLEDRKLSQFVRRLIERSVQVVDKRTNRKGE